MVQRQVLYLGEINGSQQEAWCRVIEAFDEGAQQTTQLALFPADRPLPEHAEGHGVQIRLGAMQLHRPRQWGACWLARHLYEQLELDCFWAARLPDSREGTCWRHILETLVCYRLIDPGSEWRLHRLWFEQSAMGDLLGEDFALVEKNALYRCLDKLVEHKPALFTHLRRRWQDLFGARFDVLLYDLTSTYFESDPPSDDSDKRRHGYSRDKRPDCVQVVIALVVTPDGFPLAYEVLPGNTADKTTLRAFLSKIEAQYGKAERIWVMDRGIPTEETLAEMRQSDPPIGYLVGTPKGRLSKLEKSLIGLPWRDVRPGVEVKLLAEDDDLYVFAQSRARIDKERAMRKRQLKQLWARLAKLAHMDLTRESLLMKLGAAHAKAPAAWRLLDINGRPRHSRPHLRAQPQEYAPGTPTRSPLSAAHQPARPIPPSCGGSTFNSSKSRRRSRPQGRSQPYDDIPQLDSALNGLLLLVARAGIIAALGVALATGWLYRRTGWLHGLAPSVAAIDDKLAAASSFSFVCCRSRTSAAIPAASCPGRSHRRAEETAFRNARAPSCCWRRPD